MRRIPASLRLLSAVLIFSLLLSGHAPVRAASSEYLTATLSLSLEGQEKLYPGQVIMDGPATFVPVDEVGTRFGAGVLALRDSDTAKLLLGTTVVQLKVGDRTAKVGEQSKLMEAAPIRVGGRVYVSVEFMAELMELGVEWNVDRTVLTLSESPSRLEEIRVEPMPDGRQRVAVRTSRSVELKPPFLLSNPDRFGLDLPGVKVYPETAAKTVTVVDDILKSVRVSQFAPDCTRVVLDLATSAKFTVRKSPEDPRVIYIEPTFSIRGVAFESNADGGQIVVSSNGGPLHYQMHNLSGPPYKVVVDIDDSTLVTGFTETTYDHFVIESVTASQYSPGVVRVVIQMKRPYPVTVRQDAAQPGRMCLALGTMVRGISVNDTPGNVEITITTSQRAQTTVRPLPTPERQRLYVDFEDAVLDLKPDDLKSNNPMIKEIRAARNDKTVVRVVFELAYFIGFDWERVSDTEIRIRLAKSSIVGKKVVIDPGHGGADGGTAGTLADGTVVSEKSCNLTIAQKLYSLLEQAGAIPVLTRDSDVNVDLAARAELANSQKADVFVSIHHNAANSSRSQAEKDALSGVEVYYRWGSGPSRTLGYYIFDALPKAIGLKARTLSEHWYRLTVLERTTMPAVLVEVAYLTSSTDLKLIPTDDFQQKAAQGLFNGLVNYFSEAGQGFPSYQSTLKKSEPTDQMIDLADPIAELTTGLGDIDLSELGLTAPVQ